MLLNIQKPSTFNLVEEPWIPVLWLDGRFERVGIRTALTQAGRIRQIAASNPMDNLAVLRFLVALLYWCRGNPSEQDGQNEAHASLQPATDWISKLDQERCSFDLVGDNRRFYQTSMAKRSRPATDLLQEIPTGNNFSHFRHSVDGKDGLCLACCAMGLLRLPLFSVSGLRDLKAGINGTPPIYVVPVGPSLQQTLCLNWQPVMNHGTAAWEPASSSSGTTRVSILEGLTSLSRHVWLHQPTSPCGCCAGCGREQMSLIRTCEFQSAGVTRNENWHDPHVVYVERVSKDGKKNRKALTAEDLSKKTFRMDRPWARLLTGLLPSGLTGDQFGSVRLHMIGFATDQAKNIDVWERRCDVPSMRMSDCEAGVISDTIGAWNLLWARLAKRIDSRKSRKAGTRGVAAFAAVRPHVEHTVSLRIAGLLVDPERWSQQATDDSRSMILTASRSVLPDFTSQAVQRRREIVTDLAGSLTKPAMKARNAESGR